jgi:RNase P/RNase MRP subunit p30
MREFIDALVFDKKCVDFGRKLGYAKVLFDEIAYCEPRTAKDIKIDKSRLNFVRGGELSLNQAIVRKRGVNVLLDPIGQRKEFDTAVGQIAKDYNIFIGFSLRSILEAKRANRPRLLANIASTVGICKKMKNDMIIVSGARDIYCMRAPEDLASIGTLFGLTNAQSLWAISENPRALLEELK